MPQEQRFGLLEMKLSTLSYAHRNTLHSLVRHLSNVNSNSQLNKMNIQNLALIFTPVIFHDFNQVEKSLISYEWSPEDLFEDLILYHEMLFPISEEKARRLNENKLQMAMKGDLYSQFSQSNLLYKDASLPPKHPEKTSPKLTTIIGQPPDQPPDQPAFLDKVNNRSTSDTVTLKRGFSLSRKKRNSKGLARAHSCSESPVPSLPKTRHPQYKPELSPETLVPSSSDGLE
ncbi:hypothetical protein G6F56_012245 [Rhizopus delemar]|nr:hypothetical protein G6F56_012245 [Rhizopus delemar]